MKTTSNLWKEKGIDIAIIEFFTKILSAHENRQIGLGICLCLSKAYDNINHEYKK